MNITLIISDNCEACDRAKKVIERICNTHPQITIETIDIGSYRDKRISITPALVIDKQLFSYGDIDEERLFKKLN